VSLKAKRQIQRPQHSSRRARSSSKGELTAAKTNAGQSPLALQIMPFRR